jgi:hypothetical protein
MGDGTGGIVTRGVPAGVVAPAEAVGRPSPFDSSSSPPQAARRTATRAMAARSRAIRRGFFIVTLAIIG